MGMRKLLLAGFVAISVGVGWGATASADDLYSTDFESMSVGTINGQDGWMVGNGDGTSTDGMVLDDGTGNQVLQVLAGENFADPESRLYSAVSTRRYQVITLWFMTLDGGIPHWWMDHWHVDGVDAIFWWSNGVANNANPGSPPSMFNQGEWHQVGIEVDQDSGMLNAVMFDGYWQPEDDSAGAGGPGPHDRFLLQGLGAEERLWIDDLSVTDRDDSVLCDPVLYVSFPPSGDPQSWIDGLNVSVNGAVVPPPGCPIITRIEWNWGDGSVNDSWFPATHTYGTPGNYTVTVTAFNEVGNSSTKMEMLQDVGGGELEVLIDIKPGSEPNCININGHGLITVAVLGASDFDVAQIDAGSLAFGGLAVQTKVKGNLHCSHDDVSGDPVGLPDGYMDLVCHFVDTVGFEWDFETGTAELNGSLQEQYGSTRFRGIDTICIVPPE